MLAVEIEGGVRGKGRHTKADGFIEDCHKYNAMVQTGWRLLRFTGEMLDADPTACIEQVRQVLTNETRPVA